MIVRRGNAVAEGYFRPFDKDTKKRAYSFSKSIVSLAVGKLCGEGILSDYNGTASGKAET